MLLLACGLTTRSQLSENKLSGTVPSLQRLSALEFIFLASNQLSGSVPDLSVHPKLRQAHLHINNFSGTFPDVSKLTSLERL